MKNLLIISAFLIFVGCGRKQTAPASDPLHPISEIKAEAKEEKTESMKDMAISYADLQGKVFEIGRLTHFTDTCSFYFECDCCAGDLVFNSDRTFYIINHCMSDKSLASGGYSLNGSTLTLNLSGICVSRKYNWENESDTSAVDYFITDTIVSPSLLTYTTSLCNNKIKLTRNDLKEIAILTNSNYAKFLELLNNEKFIGRLEELKKSQNNDG
jgi:hypothetical protein